MSDFVTGLDGKQVRTGDRIAYAVTEGRSACIRIGVVVDIVWEHTKNDRYWGDNHKVPTKLRVQVEKSSFGTLFSDKPTLIEAGLMRFVKVD